jgi:hypothetical protein
VGYNVQTAVDLKVSPCRACCSLFMMFASFG